jgi:hypothetical protein
VANNESSPGSEQTPRRARDEAQLILGQIHGVLWLAVNDADYWLTPDSTTEGGEPALTADDVRRAAAEIHGHFGTVHAALNTGKFDDRLLKVGMTGAQGHAKKKGFAPAIGRFFGDTRQTIQKYVSRLRSSLRWSGTLIGSITAALEEEIKNVPGAALAAEAIKEFIEVLLNATESPEGAVGKRAERPVD